MNRLTLLTRCRKPLLAAGSALLLVLAAVIACQPPTAPPVAEADSEIPAYPAAVQLAVGQADDGRPQIQLCQNCGPQCAPGGSCNRPIHGIDCRNGDGCGELQWGHWGPIPWQAFNQGEYVGPARSPHVEEYRIRPDDEIEFVFRLTREEQNTAYRLQVGDKMRIESLIDPTLDRDVTVQPDGNITVRLLGQVRAAKRTIMELEEDLEERYKAFVRIPDLKSDLTITPAQLNTRLTDLLDAVNNRFFSGGLGKRVIVTPEGTVALPGIGSFCVQGLTIPELQTEVNERYAQLVTGLELQPILAKRAPRFLYVVGEVRNPNRFALEGPTTLMQSIALAGGWLHSGNLREIVVFRRAEDWRLLATRIDIRGAMLGKSPNPADEIWLRDSDVVVVPKSPIKRGNDAVDLLFSQGLYRVAPITYSFQMPGTL
jgi:polysaccharide export outer membrane protein